VDNLRSPRLKAPEMLVVEERWGLSGQMQGDFAVACLFGWCGSIRGVWDGPVVDIHAGVSTA
jgi:hypothetical protein